MKINSKDIVLVSIQLVLFILFTIPVSGSLEFLSWFKNVGLIASIIGFIVLAIAILQLNKNLSPFPTPKADAVLIQNGLYTWVRHPIYSGILIIFFWLWHLSSITLQIVYYSYNLDFILF